MARRKRINRSKLDPAPSNAAPLNAGSLPAAPPECLPQQAASPPRWAVAAVIVALAASTFVAYNRVLHNEFIYLDDRTYVTENEVVQKGLTWDGMAWAFSTTHGANWHPLTWLSHMMDCQLFGLDPLGHHLTNLLLHVFSVILVFHLMRRMTRAVLPSAFVAAAFALHPAHVESVAWVAERKDVLCTLFGLLTTLAYIRYVERRTIPRYIAVLVLFAFGLMAKPMLVTLPFVFLLLDYWPLGRFHNRAAVRPVTRARIAALAVEKVPLLILASLSSAVTLYAQQVGGAMMTQAMLPVGARVANALVSYVQYAAMAFWPSRLAVYYPHPLKAYPTAEVVGAAAVLVAVTIAVIATARKHPYLLVGWLWFLGTLVPVIGLVQVGGQAIADRYTYLPYIGLFIAIAWCVRSTIATPSPYPLAQRGRGVSGLTLIAVRAAAISVLGALGAITWVQAGYWHDSKRLFQHALDVVPNNTQAHLFMAQTLVREGRVADAVPHFAEAVRIVPNEPYSLKDYGLALYESGRIDEATAQFEQAVRLMPSYADGQYFLGVVRGKENRPKEAITHLEEALRLDPKLLHAHQYIGSAYADQRQFVQAIQHFQKWLAIDPKSSETLIGLGRCYSAMGNADAAREAMQKAVDANPGDAFALAALAQIVSWQGDAETAIGLYERALRASPDYAQAANNLAMLYATVDDARLRNADRAVELAEHVCRTSGFKDPVSLDTLAAAYAEAGRFDDARDTISKAIDIARSAGEGELVRHLEQRMANYVAGRSLRQGEPGSYP